MGTIRTPVAGVTFQNDDGSSRQEILRGMSKGRKLRFRDAASAEHPEAISVHNVKGAQLGSLPSDVAHYVRERSVAPADLKGEVYSIAKNKNDSALGCIIDFEHGDLETGAVGYESVAYTGGIDWDAVRAYVGKGENERVTADDVRAYQSGARPAAAQTARPSVPPRPAPAAESSSRPARKSGSAGKAAIGCIWIVVVALILLKILWK